MIKFNIQEAKPVNELSSVRTSPARTRVAGLLKGQLNWEPDAFDPMTNEELDRFDASSVVSCGTTTASEES